MSTISNLIFKNAKHYITSPFGYRKDPITGKSGAFHSGTDYGTDNKKIAQYAIEDGYVFASAKASDGANYVWIIYPRIKKAFLHYHLDARAISSGAKVTRGTKIGTTGKTGKSTGIHLHLGVRELNGLNEYQMNNMNWTLLRNCPYIDPEGIKYEEPKVVQNSTTSSTSNFLPARGYWKKGDKDVKVGYMCDYFYVTFPGYAKSLKKDKENLKGNLFGDNLEAWVKMFQKNTGLVADGMVGPKTYDMMKKYGFKH